MTNSFALILLQISDCAGIGDKEFGIKTQGQRTRPSFLFRSSLRQFRPQERRYSIAFLWPFVECQIGEESYRLAALEVYQPLVVFNPWRTQEVQL